MSTKLIRVKTLARSHVAQLHLEHYWPWESRFDFNTVEVIGRIANSGDILCREKTGALRLISCVAFMDWATAEAGAILPNGEYAPTPHTKYVDEARARWDKLPQLFQE